MKLTPGLRWEKSFENTKLTSAGSGLEFYYVELLFGASLTTNWAR